MIQNAARSGGPPPRQAGARKTRKKTPIAARRRALQQLIHRGSGSTDSTMLRRPSYRDRRTFPGLRVPRCRAHRRVTGFPDSILFGWLVTPTRCTACKWIRRATTCVAPWHDDSGIQAAAIRLRSRFIVDSRSALVGLVRHAYTPSFRTNPIARMERKAARSRRRHQRRSDYPGRSAIHVCNTIRCVSVFFHSLVPVSDTSDPLKRLPGSTSPAIALTAHTTMQGAHHASCRKASRAPARPRTSIAPRQKARTFRN